MRALSRSHPHEMMGALYEDVENFFGDIFAWYGRVVARFPWLFVTVPLLACGLLGLGLFGVTFEPQLEVLYTPIDSQTARDKVFLKQLFQDESGSDFYARQQIELSTFGEVIVRRPEVKGHRKRLTNHGCPDDILSPDTANEIWRLRDMIMNLSVTEDGHPYSYQDVCALRDHRCVVDGIEALTAQPPASRSRRTYMRPRDLNKHLRYTSLPRTNNSTVVIATKVLSGMEIKDNVTCYDVIRLRFNLRHNGTVERARSLAWERAFVSGVSQFYSSAIEITYAISESLDTELQNHIFMDARYLGVSVLAMLVFATITGSGANCVTNHVTLAYAGVFAALMAILATFGLLSLFGLRLVNMCGVMPFLVLAIGADDMFQLMTEWRQSNIRDKTEDRMASTMRSTAVSITITSLTDIIAFCIGATSPFVSVRNFCACSGVAILMLYLTQLTFYSGCMVLHARRVQASRHWITCCTTKSREELEDEGSHPATVCLCSGNPPRRIGEDGGVCRKVARLLYTYYPRFLLHWVTKCAVFLLFIGYFSLSVWGAFRIKKGLKLEEVVPSDSYLREYLEMDMKYFANTGPIITFVSHGPHRFTDRRVLYHHKNTQDDIATLLGVAESAPDIVNGSHISWLEQYLKYRHDQNMSTPHSETEFIEGLVNGFFIKYPTYKHDIHFSLDHSLILASRFYVRSRKLHNSGEEGEMMLQMRRIANSSPLSVVAYSPDFVYFEHYTAIMKNTFLPVGVTMIGLLFVALVFIPHPIAVTCVTIAMISIVFGMVGFMHFWDLSLSAISVIQIIMSLGICVSFTVHMSHSFMTATGKNRNERVTVAIEKVGIPILNGTLSSLFCAVTLSFGTSFIFISFFKTMVLLFFLGVIHSLVFLPVMLSFIGPRRTSKPRVFIPVSPSSRSLQDTYRANSIVHGLPTDSLRSNRESPRHSVDKETPDLNTTATAATQSSTKRGLETIDEVEQPADAETSSQQSPEDVDSPDESRARKVSFAIGETPSIRSELDSGRHTSETSNVSSPKATDDPCDSNQFDEGMC